MPPNPDGLCLHCWSPAEGHIYFLTSLQRHPITPTDTSLQPSHKTVLATDTRVVQSVLTLSDWQCIQRVLATMPPKGLCHHHQPCHQRVFTAITSPQPNHRRVSATGHKIVLSPPLATRPIPSVTLVTME